MGNAPHLLSLFLTKCANVETFWSSCSMLRVWPYSKVLLPVVRNADVEGCRLVVIFHQAHLRLES